MLTNREIEQATVALMTALLSNDREQALGIVSGITDPKDLQRFVYSIGFLFRSFADNPPKHPEPLGRYLRFVGLAVAGEERAHG